MKRNIIIVMTLISLFALQLGTAAKTVKNNLCEGDIEITWSGTWLHAGTDGENNPGTNLFDGDYTNKWGSNDIRSTGEEWVKVAFAKPEKIDGFLICQEPSGAYTNIKQYTIQIQNGTEDWEVVYTSPEFDEFWLEDSYDFETPVTATAVRFHCTNDKAAEGTHTPAGQCAVELSEIEIYQNTVIEDTPSPEPTKTAVKTNTPVPPTQTPSEEPTDSSFKSGLIIALIAVATLATTVVVVIIVKKNKK